MLTERVPPIPDDSPFVSGNATLSVINLDTGESFDFSLFPTELNLKSSADWKPQNITRGTRPLLYGANPPQELSFEVWLDGMRDPGQSGSSVTHDLLKLQSWQRPADRRGAPPALLVAWGDSTFHCVLAEIGATAQNFRRTQGFPLRAKLELAFLELQDEADPTQRSTATPRDELSGPQTGFGPGLIGGTSVFGPDP